MNWKFSSGMDGRAAPVRTVPTLGLPLHPRSSRSIVLGQQLQRDLPHGHIQNRAG